MERNLQQNTVKQRSLEEFKGKSYTQTQTRLRRFQLYLTTGKPVHDSFLVKRAATWVHGSAGAWVGGRAGGCVCLCVCVCVCLKNKGPFPSRFDDAKQSIRCHKHSIWGSPKWMVYHQFPFQSTPTVHLTLRFISPFFFFFNRRVLLLGIHHWRGIPYCGWTNSCTTWDK